MPTMPRSLIWAPGSSIVDQVRDLEGVVAVRDRFTYPDLSGSGPVFVTVGAGIPRTLVTGIYSQNALAALSGARP
jgi:hypothetical protein